VGLGVCLDSTTLLVIFLFKKARSRCASGVSGVLRWLKRSKEVIVVNGSHGSHASYIGQGRPSIIY